MKVMISGGGTGGHVYPGIAVAEEFRRIHPSAGLVFVGSTRGLESQAVPESGFRIRYLSTRSFPRRAWWRWPAAIAANAIGMLQALWIVGQERPDVVLGTGGYVSGPVCLAAVLLRRPLILQEQNSIPGLANRWFARFADEVHLSFTEARAYFARKDHLRVTGNPVRSHILGGDRGAALRAFDLAEGRPTVFVFGGSLGAHRINEAALETMRALKGRVEVQFILQTGRDDFEWARRTVEEEGLPAKVMPFLRQIHLAYAAADLVVCRSGAMTLAEIAACGTPAILVPYPYAAHNHQEVNAHNLVERGAAVLILDRELTGERLAREVAHLLADRQALRRLSAHARTFARLDAAERIVHSLERYEGGRRVAPAASGDVGEEG
ncbi:MAG: undecaprenyldiphospho-muramoylpentapeptide beta-N-acetylglucosaminyltransferase [Candidatus Eisenbacteria bacterium]|uniref:UDP-N-acetylglucosamine--N-acetylmuramyl-(pentapeptide) pyrophosphoryl-undecaprenol N-acetylglucosamine transferase n=1 Tax=Eiseniibacteriota bacterium TaxID=2212470 RepID=A0A538TV32_UNCEI|nr:MAG: undecaprenyldiphospho-muramoylpentapeptide beta-N-acetylglucosaminyltransferase [Candidatus Eisenbacteria bacterium]